MRDILRLIITLFVVGVASAVLLTGLNAVTAPIIEEREEREYREAIQYFFPDMASFEEDAVEGVTVDRVYDAGGAFLGVIGTFREPGFEGYIYYNLAVNSAGEILGIRIVSHSETPGIGDVIAREEFKKQFTGKTYLDPIEAGNDVDIITGATVSTQAVVGSVRRSLAEVVQNFLDIEEEVFDITAVPDGTYTGSAMGHRGEILLEVTFSEGRIVEITILDNSETPTYFIEAHPAISDLIIETQSLDIDTRTGATVSGDAIVRAVFEALQKGLESGMDNGGGEDGE